MTEIVFEIMEEKGIVFNDKTEMNEISKGVHLFLEENGIPDEECSDYFKRYTKRLVDKIKENDLKQYFLHYRSVSAVRQICVEYTSTGLMQEDKRQELRKNMELLYKVGLGEKYIPADVVKEILGRFA